jgi:AraC-like DNA-binding protein
MNQDPLTDILALANARCVISRSFSAGGRWAVRFPPPGKIKFVAVVKGCCLLDVIGVVSSLRLETGDAFMLAAEPSYKLASDLAAPEQDGFGMYSKSVGNSAVVGSGGDFLAISGHIDLDPEHADVLTEVLPPLIHVNRRSPEASAIRWLLDQLVREVATDSDRPGAALASEQFALLLFLQILRAHMATTKTFAVGWLGALVDERIAQALHLMHRQPGRAWQLCELAKEIGMSRTSFALRFKALTGVAPLTYLLQWRMRLAERGLRQGSLSVSKLGLSLGYSSESAFSNAFKRTVGMAPKQYRSIAASSTSGSKLNRPRSNLRQAAVHEKLHAVDIARSIAR